MNRYRISADGAAAVSMDFYWDENMRLCPKGIKVLLLTSGGVATVSTYDGDAFFTAWAPLPKLKRMRLSQAGCAATIRARREK